MSFIVTGGYWQDQGYYTSYSNPQFDAGARSVEELTADGAFTFTVGQATGIICGLNAVDNDADYLEIEHAFYVENGKVRVVENGVFKTAFSNYTTGAVFKIDRIGSTVRYFVNNVLHYTSLLVSTGTVFLDCSLYAANDTVILGGIEAYDRLEFTLPKTALYLEEALALEIPLPNPSVILLETDSQLVFDLPKPTLYLEEALSLSISLPEPTLALIADEDLHITLPKPELLVWDEDTSTLIFTLPKPTLYIRETLIVPDYSILQFSIPNPQLRLNEEENLSLEIAVPAPAVVISQDSDFLHITLPSVSVGLQEAVQDLFVLSWPKWLMTCVIPINEALWTLPTPTFSAKGTRHTSSSSLPVPAPTFAARGGGVSAFSMPAPVFAAAGTVQQVGRFAATLPEPVFAATGLVGSVGDFVVTVSAPQMTGLGGAVSAWVMPAPVFAATGKVAHIATAALQIPAPILVATGTVYNLGRATLVMPSPVFYAGKGNEFIVEVAAPILVATGTYRGTTAETTAETTYAVNLNTGAVTQLLLGGFDKLVAAHGRLYGLKDGALTRLDGDVDGTDTVIPATIRFAPQTFGTNAVKRISDVYWSARETAGMTMELVADEKTVWRYQTATDTAPAYGTHKVKTGRGVVFHTAGFVVRNRNGGTLDIGGGEFMVSPLTRKPR